MWSLLIPEENGGASGSESESKPQPGILDISFRIKVLAICHIYGTKNIIMKW